MNALVGTGQLIRLILRRDRFLLLAWIVIIAIIPVSFVSAFLGLFPTEAERQMFAGTVQLNPVFTAFYGQLFSSSIGGLVVWRSALTPIVVGVISLLTVIRHTRTEEEAGRCELLGSAVIGRHAGLAAVLSVTTGANLVLALLIGFGMMSQKLPVAGSFALGLKYAAVGWIFSAIGAVTAQLTSRAGTARALALSVLGFAFLLRIAGDVSSFSWLSWLSPLAWAEQIRPFANERWLIFVPIVGLVFGLTAAAFLLLSRRDLGGGLLPTRPGPATAVQGFNSPIALAWRLHRDLLTGWTAGFAALGATIGGIAASVGDMLKDNSQLQDIIARLGGSAGIVDTYFAGIMGIFALVAGGYAIQATLRMRSEEIGLRGEPVLATSVGRLQWAMSHLLFSVFGSMIVLASTGLTAGVIHGINVHDLTTQLPRVLASAMVQLPAVWVLIGIAVALFGLVPKLTGLSWVAMALFVLLGLVGAVLQLPKWTLDISPFTHIPKVPGGEFSAMPLIIMVGIAVLLMVIGLVRFRHRDFGRV